MTSRPSDLPRDLEGFEWLCFRLRPFTFTAVNHSLASAEPNNDPDDLSFVGMAERFVREPGQFLNQAFHGSH
ncbi:hypothetical protein [Cyanobium sp. Candia 9D4]|uniref:hypothetical protein n=1 Tax=Cyanobium sp. Candia 9D4 TaxID=2823707 RepID=UPI0020CF3B50|nr:hypothetical protein [Cyanobium sp. Candia 9D4]